MEGENCANDVIMNNVMNCAVRTLSNAGFVLAMMQSHPYASTELTGAFVLLSARHEAWVWDSLSPWLQEKENTVVRSFT